MKRRHIVIVIVLFIVIFSVMAITSMLKKSPVCDEVSHHIGSGYSFLKTGDFRLNSTSPPLIEEIAAIPLLFLNPKLPLDHSSWQEVDRAGFGFQFLYRYGNDAKKIVFLSRIPMVIIAVLCGILVFIFARDLYGDKAGLFALFLYSFSPNILAYSRLAIPDIGNTFFILLAIYRFYKFLNKPKLRNVILLGVAFGLALVSKMSALILIPFFTLICFYMAISKKRFYYIGALLAIFVMSLALLFLSYFGETKPLLQNDVDVAEKIGYISSITDKLFPGNHDIKESVIDFALNRPIPFATYTMNILGSTNMVYGKRIFDSFLMGRYSATGWWYYYIVVFLLKTPIPILILLMLLVIYFSRVKPKHVCGEKIGILFIIIFSVASIFSKLQLSVRYILPIYPLCYIYISKLINVRIKKQRFINIALYGLCFWYLANSLSIYPNYIAFFNNFAGGPNNGSRYLRDANIDFGQDLIQLSDYLRDNNIPEVRLLYFGTADPAYYGVRYKNLEEADMEKPRQAVYALSVNSIDSVKWKDKIEPDYKAGYSIFIYDLRSKN